MAGRAHKHTRQVDKCMKNSTIHLFTTGYRVVCFQIKLIVLIVVLSIDIETQPVEFFANGTRLIVQNVDKFVEWNRALATKTKRMFVSCQRERPSAEQAVASTERCSSATVLTNGVISFYYWNCGKLIFRAFCARQTYEPQNGSQSSNIQRLRFDAVTFQIIFLLMNCLWSGFCMRHAFANIALMLSNDCGWPLCQPNRKHLHRFQCAITLRTNRCAECTCENDVCHLATKWAWNARHKWFSFLWKRKATICVHN